MSQSLTLDVKGLYTYSSDVAGVPPGTLAVADNVNITRINILEPRRGFEYQYNGANVLTFGSSGDRVKKFVFWKESNYIHYASTFALFSGSGVSSRGTLITPTNATSIRDVSFSNKNLYLTNSTGLLKTDAVATSLYSAGVPKGLAISVTNASTSTSPGTAITANKYVSYRYIIGRKDVNGNTVLGAPSGRVTFQAPAYNCNTDVLCEIPTGLDSSYFIQVYRSAESTTAETSDEMYLVFERFLSATTSSKNISQISRTKVYDDVYKVEVVTSTAHGFVEGQKVVVTATTNTSINGTYFVLTPTSTIFYYYQIGTYSPISLTSDSGTAVYPGDFTSGTAVIQDTTPSDLTGATLYTSPSQEGAVNENNEPPVASDIAEYQNLMWYADTESKQRITLSLISAVPLIGTTITIGTETYTFRSFRNYKERIVESPTYKVNLATVAKNGNTVTVTTSVAHELQVNDTINFQPSNDPTNLAGTNRTVVTVPTSTSFTLTISAGSNINPAVTDTGFLTKNSSVATTSALAINVMAESLIRNINLNPSGSYYAYSASSANDTFPGRIIIEARSYSQSQFFVTSSQPTYWQPQLVSPAQNDNKSQNDAFRNGLMYSKADQPEAVPYKNIFRVGSADDPILRIWAARDALFVFKKRDGLWIIRGETEANFTKNQLDSTAKLFAPDSLASVNNNIYALMEAGICEISDTGVNVISFPIRDQLFQNYTSYASNTYSYAFGVGNDIDGKYILSLPTSSSNAYCEKQIVYDVYSKIFCGNWSIESTAGRLNQIDAKIYFGPTSNKIKKELRTFSATDFVDEYQTLSIVSVDATGLILTLSSVSGLAVNDVIKQGTTYVYLLAVNNTNNTVTVDMIESWTTGVANLVHYKALDIKVEWNSEFAGNPAGFKHFYEMSLLQKSSFLISSTFYFRNDINASENSITIAAPSYSGNWGDFTWGDEVWGGDPSSNTPVRLGVPRTHARCSQLRVRWEHKVAYSDFQVQGISLAYNPTSTRITNNAAQ